MDPKAELRAQLEEAELRRVPKWNTKLYIIIGVLVIALIAVCIGGGLYILNLQRSVHAASDTGQDDVTDQQTIYHITYINGEKKQEDEIKVDQNKQTQMFIDKNTDGDIDMISVTDFNKGIHGVYIPEFEECFLVSGIFKWFPNMTASIKAYQSEDGKTIETNKELGTVYFTVVSHDMVRDLSIVPQQLQPFCEGKPLYWTEETNKDASSGTRQKRGCWQVTVCAWFPCGTNPDWSTHYCRRCWQETRCG